MKTVLRAAGLVLTAIIGASFAIAEGTAVTYTVDQDFDDITFGLENAITNKGLIIDSVSHVGVMLERTKTDVGSDVTIFKHAEVYSFCSASLSRKMMEADPMNLQFCPYGIFVMQKPGEDVTTIGYRVMPKGAMKEVEAMLDEIVHEAIGE